MMFTKFELSILSLLIFNFAQDFFLNLAKEDLVQSDIPDEDNVRHYVITAARIVGDAVLYPLSSLVDFCVLILLKFHLISC